MEGKRNKRKKEKQKKCSIMFTYFLYKENVTEKQEEKRKESRGKKTNERMLKRRETEIEEK